MINKTFSPIDMNHSQKMNEIQTWLGVSTRVAMTEEIDVKDACMINGGGKRGEVRHIIAILTFKTNIHYYYHNYYSITFLMMIT